MTVEVSWMILTVREVGLEVRKMVRFTSLRLSEVAAMMAAPPRVRSRREEQARQATKCLTRI